MKRTNDFIDNPFSSISSEDWKHFSPWKTPAIDIRP